MQCKAIIMFAKKAEFGARNDKISFKLWKSIARIHIKIVQEQSKMGLTSNFSVALALPLPDLGSVEPIPFHLLPLGSPKSMAIIMGWTWQRYIGPGMCFSSSRVWFCGWLLWLTPLLALLADRSSWGCFGFTVLSACFVFWLGYHFPWITLFFFFGRPHLWTKFLIWKHMIWQKSFHISESLQMFPCEPRGNLHIWSEKWLLLQTWSFPNKAVWKWPRLQQELLLAGELLWEFLSLVLWQIPTSMTKNAP